jgi:hypothetical protein
MEFDPSKARMTAQEKAEEARARAEGTRSRAAAIAFLGDVLTSPANPMDAEQLEECKSTLFWKIPEIKDALDLMCRRYSAPREMEVLRACLLATAIEATNRLFCD